MMIFKILAAVVIGYFSLVSAAADITVHEWFSSENCKPKCFLDERKGVVKERNGVAYVVLEAEQKTESQLSVSKATNRLGIRGRSMLQSYITGKYEGQFENKFLGSSIFELQVNNVVVILVAVPIKGVK